MTLDESARMARGIIAFFLFLLMAGLTLVRLFTGDVAGAVWPALLGLGFYMAGKA